MLAVCSTSVTVRMTALLGSDVKSSALSPSHSNVKLEGNVKERTRSTQKVGSIFTDTLGRPTLYLRAGWSVGDEPTTYLSPQKPQLLTKTSGHVCWSYIHRREK